MDIQISDKWRLHKIDPLNFELEEYRRPIANNMNVGKELIEEWRGTGHYFQSIPSALVWLLDHRCINDQGECANLREAIEAMKTIADDLKNVRLES